MERRWGEGGRKGWIRRIALMGFAILCDFITWATG